MRLVHQGWQLVGQILIVDDEGNAINLGKDAQGNEAKLGTIAIGVERFRGNSIQAAYEEARLACDRVLADHQEALVGPGLELVGPTSEEQAAG